MSRETADQVLRYLAASGAVTLDLTGGAPELNPNFRHLVAGARALGARVIDRCNLTILMEPGYEDLAQFLADQRVDIVASLPCYTPELVDRQRGKGVYELSIAGKPRTHLKAVIARDLEGNAIAVRDHCYGCTAGQGSSCAGALA